MKERTIFSLYGRGCILHFGFFFRGGRLFLLTAILQLDYVYGEGCCNKSIFWITKMNSENGTPIEQNFM